MTDTTTLGIALGALLGFLVGALVVGLVALYFKKKTKSYDTGYSPDGGPRRSVEYFASPPQNLVPSHTRPVPIQPNIYRLNKETEEEQADEEDGEERVRVTEPYDHRAVQMGVIDENGESKAEITELDASVAQDSPATKRKKLTRGQSLPTNIVSSDLINYNQDILTTQQQCVLETSMFYDTASKELHVTVIQVLGIPTPDESFLRPPNCSVKMRILPEMLAWQWTRKVSRTVSPVFNETFIIPGFVHNKLRECTVHFVVLDFDHVQDNVYVIGEVFMPLSELRANRLEKISKRVNPLSI